MSQLIPLTRGQFALVDDADYAWLIQFKWRLNSKGYAIRSIYVEGRETYFNMHRVIMDAQPGQVVDHIDSNRLNNTRGNLRFITQQQNLMHRKVFENNPTGLKGVRRRENRWQARIGFNDEIIHLGYYIQSDAAAQAYDMAARLLFGEYALLNFPYAPAPPEIDYLVSEILALMRLP